MTEENQVVLSKIRHRKFEFRSGVGFLFFLCFCGGLPIIERVVLNWLDFPNISSGRFLNDLCHAGSIADGKIFGVAVPVVHSVSGKVDN